MTVSIEHTYKRSSSALSLKPTIPVKNDDQLAWGTDERTFKTTIFQHEEPGFKDSTMTRFVMLAPCKMVLGAEYNVPQLRTIF